jgi:hypothetical protein
MAWLEKRAYRFRINYRIDGRKQQVSLRTGDPKEADACLHRFEENRAADIRHAGHARAAEDLGLAEVVDDHPPQSTTGAAPSRTEPVGPPPEVDSSVAGMSRRAAGVAGGLCIS